MSSQQLARIKEIPDDYNFNEAIKTLRTNLQFSGKSIRTVMLTSSMPNEGKSSVSFALAHALAQIGKRTVLVDADIRKSILIDQFELPGEYYGLSQYLSGQCNLTDMIYETDQEGLNVIFSGPYSPNPAELLEEELCGQMFEELKQFYDYIIVDTPPMAKVIDGAILACHCDGVVMVVESGSISYHLEQRVKSQLEKTGCRLLGVVLNKLDIHSDRYYGKYGRYGKYAKYGEYGYGEYRREESGAAERTGRKRGKKKKLSLAWLKSSKLYKKLKKEKEKGKEPGYSSEKSRIEKKESQREKESAQGQSLQSLAEQEELQGKALEASLAKDYEAYSQQREYEL